MRELIKQHAFRMMCRSRMTGYLSSLYGDEANIRYPIEWIFPVKRVPFDDINAPIEANADEYLTRTYGDYMELPPLEKQVFHHDYVCVDFETPYTDYKGVLYCKENVTK